MGPLSPSKDISNTEARKERCTTTRNTLLPLPQEEMPLNPKGMKVGVDTSTLGLLKS